MSALKYYYKSPEEIQEKLKDHRVAVHPYRNRTFLMILADTSIFLLIFFILYYSGFLDLWKDREKNRALYEGMEFILLPGSGSGDTVDTLSVHNREDHSRVFPEKEGNFALHRFERVRQTTHAGLVSTERETIDLEKRILNPGQTDTIALPPGKLQKGESVLYRMTFQNGKVIELVRPDPRKDLSP